MDLLGSNAPSTRKAPMALQLLSKVVRDGWAGTEEEEEDDGK